ncbi:hypothetical protein [Clostridium cylindrosporum]|uniref:Uncharacterized protein n=1 Tax=Clostridium cylindrosporum DSM 605 TaxID=1121307 RepID=A0A0J8DA66_CLOCY|nr:hypothetical protein [Clostridium cylindrosporum]KMT22940.1 hypothetical protein CLCY_5c01790 [Clostridium cylindrosporum DSM 605]
MLIFKPDEVATLKKGSHINVEITEEDIRILKRNFCGVYELFKPDSSRCVEYFDDLILFKNRYGSVQRKFALYSLYAQKKDIYTLTENMSLKEVLRWFSQYGTVENVSSVKIDNINIDNYCWTSDIGDNVCYFSVATTPFDFKININKKIKKVV